MSGPDDPPCCSTVGWRRPSGQLVVDLAGQARSAAGAFHSPNGAALLRLEGCRHARADVRVNGRAVPAASGLLAQGADTVDLAPFAVVGGNTLQASAVDGRVRLSVDHPRLLLTGLEQAGGDAPALTALDEALSSGVGVRYAGGVVLVAARGRVVHCRAFGYAQTHQGHQPLAVPRAMTVETVFDLASVTKVLATTASLMVLHGDGRLDLDLPVAAYLPQLAGSPVASATVRQLLTHRAGLWEWQPLYLRSRTPAEALDVLAGLDLRYPRGTRRAYSDLGFMLLGAVVEALTGQRLDAYVRSRVHAPLGMVATTYRPTPGARHGCAATSTGDAHERLMLTTGQPYPVVGGAGTGPLGGWRSRTLVGEANDGNAWHTWGGVAGHAGLFSTAMDVATFAQALVNGGGYGDTELAPAATVAAFLAPQLDDQQVLGFWSERLQAVSTAGGFGHGGFTGTELLFDPVRQLVVVLLTNRLHPAGQPHDLQPVWRAVLRAALQATGR